MSLCTAPAAGRARVPAGYRPRAGLLVLARGEVRDQRQQGEGLADHGGEARLLHPQVLAHGVGVLVAQLGQLGVQPCAHRGGARPGRRRVLGQRRRWLERLALSHVGHIEHRLGSERAELAWSVRRIGRGRAPSARGGLRAAPPPPAPARRPRPVAPCRATAPGATRAPSRRSAVSRSAISSSVSTASTSESGSTAPSGWITCASSCARTTCSSASVSRMLPRKRLPRPSP